MRSSCATGSNSGSARSCIYKFLPPSKSDERFRWIEVNLAALDKTELRELILDAWRMCVPKKVAAEYLVNN